MFFSLCEIVILVLYRQNALLCDDNVLLCDDNVLVCDNNVLLCDDNVLLCDNNVLLCDDNVLLCDNNVLLCDNNVLLCDDNVLLCDNNVLLCDDKALLCDDNVLLCDDNVLLCDDKTLLCDDNDEFLYNAPDVLPITFIIIGVIAGVVVMFVAGLACVLYMRCRNEKHQGSVLGEFFSWPGELSQLPPFINISVSERSYTSERLKIISVYRTNHLSCQKETLL